MKPRQVKARQRRGFEVALLETCWAGLRTIEELRCCSPKAPPEWLEWCKHDLEPALERLQHKGLLKKEWFLDGVPRLADLRPDPMRQDVFGVVDPNNPKLKWGYRTTDQGEMYWKAFERGKAGVRAKREALRAKLAEQMAEEPPPTPPPQVSISAAETAPAPAPETPAAPNSHCLMVDSSLPVSAHAPPEIVTVIPQSAKPAPAGVQTHKGETQAGTMEVPTGAVATPAAPTENEREKDKCGIAEPNNETGFDPELEAYFAEVAAKPDDCTKLLVRADSTEETILKDARVLVSQGRLGELYRALVQTIEYLDHAFGKMECETAATYLFGMKCGWAASVVLAMPEMPQLQGLAVPELLDCLSRFGAEIWNREFGIGGSAQLPWTTLYPEIRAACTVLEYHAGQAEKNAAEPATRTATAPAPSDTPATAPKSTGAKGTESVKSEDQAKKFIEAMRQDLKDIAEGKKELPKFPPTEEKNAHLNLLILFAQVYYKLLELTTACYCHSLDMELNQVYLWTVNNLTNLLKNSEHLHDFPKPFEPMFPDLFPATVRDCDWEDMVGPEAEEFLSTVHRYVLSKGIHDPGKGSTGWVMCEMYRKGTEDAIAAATKYNKEMNEHFAKLSQAVRKDVERAEPSPTPTAPAPAATPPPQAAPGVTNTTGSTTPAPAGDRAALQKQLMKSLDEFHDQSREWQHKLVTHPKWPSLEKQIQSVYPNLAKLADCVANLCAVWCEILQDASMPYDWLNFQLFTTFHCREGWEKSYRITRDAVQLALDTRKLVLGPQDRCSVSPTAQAAPQDGWNELLRCRPIDKTDKLALAIVLVKTIEVLRDSEGQPHNDRLFEVVIVHLLRTSLDSSNRAYCQTAVDFAEHQGWIKIRVGDKKVVCGWTPEGDKVYRITEDHIKYPEVTESGKAAAQAALGITREPVSNRPAPAGVQSGTPAGQAGATAVARKLAEAPIETETGDSSRDYDLVIGRTKGERCAVQGAAERVSLSTYKMGLQCYLYRAAHGLDVFDLKGDVPRNKQNDDEREYACLAALWLLGSRADPHLTAYGLDKPVLRRALETLRGDLSDGPALREVQKSYQLVRAWDLPVEQGESHTNQGRDSPLPNRTAPPEASKSAKCMVLFLAANPKNATRLALDEECREIEQKIRAAEHRDALELVTKWAVRPDDLLQYLNEKKPHVVHFSGHGSKSEEIVLLDNNRRAKPVGAAALKQLFSALKGNIKLVLLNACFSRSQAKAITEVVDCAIGMRRGIGDKAAITFAASFYRAIGFGDSVHGAFEQGKAALMLESIPEEKTPVLLARAGVDPKTVFLLPTGIPGTEPQ